MTSSKEWYQIGDTVELKSTEYIEQYDELEAEFRIWVGENAGNQFKIVDIIQDTQHISTGRTVVKPTYTLESDMDRSPEPLYHNELILIRSKQSEWDN